MSPDKANRVPKGEDTGGRGVCLSRVRIGRIHCLDVPCLQVLCLGVLFEDAFGQNRSRARTPVQPPTGAGEDGVIQGFGVEARGGGSLPGRLGEYLSDRRRKD